MTRLLLVVNDAAFFISHRLPVALGAMQNGYEVHVAAGGVSEAHRKRIQESGLFLHELPVSRSGRNILLEMLVFVLMVRLFVRVKPDIVHLVTIKPVIYGGLAARIARVPGVVAAISGLGSVFVKRDRGINFFRKLVEHLYRLALGHPNLKVIFQNPVDRAVLSELGGLRSDQSVLIKGSGVCLRDYPLKPEPEGVPVVAFAARLLRQKGVLEFVAAARILKKEGVDARFWLIGAPDPGNPSSVTEKEVSDWNAEGVIEALGYRTDIALLFAQSNLVTLPSYYGEGLPKVLIEAAACGRAVVTTDHPGCRDAIEPDVSGCLVPPRDEEALAIAIKGYVGNPEKRKKAGSAGRRLAEREFAVEKVVNAHLAVYREVLSRRGGAL